MSNLHDYLIEEGYFFIKEIPGRGYCGLHRMLFTVGLFYGIDEWGYQGRFCYPDLTSATEAIKNWDGVADPPGEWIKHKGTAGEYDNPLTFEHSSRMIR